MAVCKFYSVGLLLLSVLLFSCDGGGVEGDKKANNNENLYSYDVSSVSVKSVHIDQAVMLAGHTGKVEVEIDSIDTKVIKNIPVSVMFVYDDKDDDNPEEVEIQQFYSGTYLINDVKPGVGKYIVDVAIPQLPQGYGSYSIVAYLYDKVMESVNPGGNLSDDEFVGATIPLYEDGLGAESEVFVDPTFEFLPDLQISGLRLSSKTHIMSGKEGEEILVDVDFEVMTLAADVNNASLKFYVQHKDGSDRTLIKARNNDKPFVESISLPPLVAYKDKTPLSYTLKFPSSFIKPLCDEAREFNKESFPYVIIVEAECPDEPSEFLDNNSDNTSIVFVADSSMLPEVLTEYHRPSSDSKKQGNKWFGISLDTESDIYANTEKISLTYEMSLPITLATKKDNMLSIEMEYHCGYYEEEGKFDFNVGGLFVEAAKLKDKVQSYYNDAKTISTCGINPEEFIEFEDISNGTINFENITATDAMKEIFKGDEPDKDSFYTVQKDISYGHTASIGPVPVSIIVGINFHAGAAYAVSTNNDTKKAGIVSATFAPYIGSNGYVKAGVGPDYLQVFGVGGKLQFVDASFPNIVSIDFEDFNDDDNNKMRRMNFILYSGLETNFLAGEIYAFVKYPGLKKKKKHGFTYYVLAILEKRKELCDWDGFSYKYTFVNMTNEILNFPLDPDYLLE